MTMTDLISQSHWAAPRAFWTTPTDGETGMPAQRIIHACALRMPSARRLSRLGMRAVPNSYPKSAGHRIRDWPTAVTVHAWLGRKWKTVLDKRNMPEPKGDKVRWFDLGGLETSALLVEARECSVDKGWTTWNLSAGAFLLEGEQPEIDWPLDTALSVGRVDVRRCPPSVQAHVLPGEVRYKSKYLEVGFRLGRPGFTYLAVDEEGCGRTNVNLVYRQSLMLQYTHPSPPFVIDNLIQGLRLDPVGSPCLLGFVPFEAKGETTVKGNVVTYTVAVPKAGQRYELRWEILTDRLLLSVQRVGERPLRAWSSGVWHTCFSSKAAVCTVLGKITREGEVGLMRLPSLLHAPGHGTLKINATGSPVLIRSDSYRPTFTTSFEIKLAEEPQPLGDYVLTTGRHKAEIELALHRPRFPVRRDTPKAVARALNRCSITAMTYRADTATFSNNGNSIHAVLCADGWSAETTRIGQLLPGLDANDLLRDTLERHFDGGPSYGSGRIVVNGDAHYTEDEYLHTGAALLRALADYLRSTKSIEWLRRYAVPIGEELKRMRARDLDGDGLIESEYRRGVSGEHQWSTQWYDMLSFGWKDAFSNAILYPALRMLADDLPKLGQPKLADGLDDWAARMKANFLPMFLNPSTGWLAGWKCTDGKLHDYAFLYVNGAAVDGGLVEGRPARAMITKLWKELAHQNLDYRLGLPGNLRPMPYDEMPRPLRPGFFENGGLTHCQARHFLAAMYKVGLKNQADHLLEAMCESLADGSAFDGIETGQEWRRRDGEHCGYEGILTDQFGVLAVAIDRYGRRRRI